MTRADYVPACDITVDMFMDMRRVAKKVHGILSVSGKGRIVIQLETDNAPELANTITNDDFPWGYVEPETNSILAFSF